MKKAALTPLKLAKITAGLASDKKAEDIIVLDMHKSVNFCDYFVICSGNSDRQVRGIADGIEEGLEQLGSKVRYKQGMQEGNWVLLDLGTVVIHVFEKATREFYGLDYLWQEAKPVKWDS